MHTRWRKKTILFIIIYIFIPFYSGFKQNRVIRFNFEASTFLFNFLQLYHQISRFIFFPKAFPGISIYSASPDRIKWGKKLDDSFHGFKGPTKKKPDDANLSISNPIRIDFHRRLLFHTAWKFRLSRERFSQPISGDLTDGMIFAVELTLLAKSIIVFSLLGRLFDHLSHLKEIRGDLVEKQTNSFQRVAVVTVKWNKQWRLLDNSPTRAVKRGKWIANKLLRSLKAKQNPLNFVKFNKLTFLKKEKNKNTTDNDKFWHQISTCKQPRSGIKCKKKEKSSLKNELWQMKAQSRPWSCVSVTCRELQHKHRRGGGWRDGPPSFISEMDLNFSNFSQKNATGKSKFYYSAFREIQIDCRGG